MICFVSFSSNIYLHHLYNTFGSEQNSICFFYPRFALICCERLISEMHHVLGSPRGFLNKSCQLPSTSEIWTNTFCNFEKYISKCLKERELAMWTNTSFLVPLEESSTNLINFHQPQRFGQIHSSIWKKNILKF